MDLDGIEPCNCVSFAHCGVACGCGVWVWGVGFHLPVLYVGVARERTYLLYYNFFSIPRPFAASLKYYYTS